MFFIILVELPTFILLTIFYFRAEDKAEVGTALIVITLILGSILLLLFKIKLETRIDEKGIAFKYTPLIRKWQTWPPNEIKSIELISYSPTIDYGGWGLKGNKTTKAYSITGDHGLLLDVGQKKSIMIGTKREKELAEFIKDWKEEWYHGG